VTAVATEAAAVTVAVAVTVAEAAVGVVEAAAVADAAGVAAGRGIPATSPRGAPVALHEIVAHLDELLEVGEVRDLCPNGLQVEGPQPVTRVVTGVSACRELFARARQLAAELVIVHHGLFWDGDNPVLTGPRFRRIAELVEGRIALAAYHLPLDRHAGLGNNALAADGLGLGGRRPFGEYHGAAVGFRGELSAPISALDLAARCETLFGRRVELFGDPDRPVATVGVVSGGAARLFLQAIDQGLDAFITGEPTEWVVNLARESGTRYLAAGHYATEVLGIRALGEHVAAKFGLDVEFVDVPNPV
jgi:dinuclear metal center YbgI/SA1388 family protein